MKNSIRFQLLFTTILALTASPVFADPAPISVNGLELKNVSQTPNRAVSVFYAIGSAATVSTGSGVPFIRKISNGPVRAEIRSDGGASVPAQQVIRKGFQIFNYLVFVVHPQNMQTVYVCNADGSIPSAQGLTGETCTSDYTNAVRVVYKAVQLDDTRTSVTQIGSTPVSGSGSVSLDLGAP